MIASERNVGMWYQCEIDHLQPDEDEDRPERVGEVVEPLLGVGQQEVHRPQAEDGERVGGEHEERLARHGEDRRHAVDGEDHVGHLDHHERGEQRGRHPLGVDAGDELVAVELVADRHQPLQQAEAGRLDLVALVGAVADHLDARVHEEHTEDQQDPPERGDERAADEDEHGAHA